MTKRDERHHKGDRTRIHKVMRLLRKRAISRAGKALESKCLGDLQNPDILLQTQNKHPVRVRQIGPDMYTFVPEAPVFLKVEKILGKLNNEGAP
jgi:hypothetical protein